MYYDFYINNRIEFSHITNTRYSIGESFRIGKKLYTINDIVRLDPRDEERTQLVLVERLQEQKLKGA